MKHQTTHTHGLPAGWAIVVTHDASRDRTNPYTLQKDGAVVAFGAQYPEDAEMWALSSVVVPESRDLIAGIVREFQAADKRRRDQEWAAMRDKSNADWQRAYDERLKKARAVLGLS